MAVTADIRNKRAIRVLLWVLTFTCAFLYLQFRHRFHFLYVEQEHLFLHDPAYLRDTLFSFGGLSKFLTDWLVQFWGIPCLGPLTVAALATLTGWFTWRCLRRLFPGVDLTILSLIPVAILVFLSYKDSFKTSLLVTSCLVAAAAWGLSMFRKHTDPQRGDDGKKTRLRCLVPGIIQSALLIVAGFLSWHASSGQSDLFKELDWYMYNDRPDAILEHCPVTGQDSFVYQNFRNWALARKGELPEKMFGYPQSSPYSLLLEWKEIAYTAILMSNIYYSMGHISLSQRMAFEANEIFDNSNPRMLRRLVETNLLFGQYDVAEKYISRLEKTLFHRSWASGRRRFLRNPELIARDPELGAKLRCIPAENNLSFSVADLSDDLADILRSNPESETTCQYYGAWLLLGKDTKAFSNFLDEFMQGRELPKAYKEAVMILSEQDPGLPARWGIDKGTVDAYGDFKTTYMQNSRKKDLRQTMNRKFGNTYWFYFLYHQNR